MTISTSSIHVLQKVSDPMLFWIFIGLTAAVFVGVIIFNLVSTYSPDFWDVLAAVGWGIAWALIPAVLGLITIVIVAATTWGAVQSHETGRDNTKLVALGTGSTVHGEFFLGSGFIDGSLTFNYVESHGKYSTLESQDAVLCTVYQDEQDAPYVTAIHYDWYEPWAVPWPVEDNSNYEFHVPKGSIDNSYSVKP